jgi:hypothetical protein
LKVVKFLRLNKKISGSYQQAKNICIVVLDEIEYRDKIDTQLKSEVNEPLSKDPAAKFENNMFSKSWPNTKLSFLDR